MKNKRLQRLITAAVLAALTCLSTFLIRIPVGNGYLHPGDGLVLLCAFLLGRRYGAAAAGIGSALADLISGFALFLPATLLIKAAAAWIAATVFGKKKTPRFAVLGGIAGEGTVLFGYLIYEWLLFGAGAIASVPANAIQGGIGLLLGTLLFLLLPDNVKTLDQ